MLTFAESTKWEDNTTVMLWVLVAVVICFFLFMFAHNLWFNIRENNRRYKERLAKRAAEEARLDWQAQDKWDALDRGKKWEGPPKAVVGHEYVLNPEPNISGEAWLVLPQWEKTKSQFAKKKKRKAPSCPYCKNRK